MAEKDQATLPGTEPDQLTLDILEDHLWSAADKLRGSIDSADYKNYIFGLLFLKRANDRFEEETEEVAEELGIPVETARDDRDLHEEFWIPERARWDYIKAQETDVGAALNKALAAVEDENDPIADRVLTTVDFNDKERLPDSLLSDLVSHFSKHRYRNEDLKDPDIFGRAYEYLIREFADDAGKKGGEFYTPREVVRLIVKCVNPEPGHRVYDPCCGSAGMLIYSAEHIRESGGDMDDISLYGQEKNLNTWAIGQMNVLLHELYDAKIEKGDTITDPQRVTKHDELEVFDRVIANPMWNQKEWSKDWVQDNEPYNRFPHGLPPSNRGDWAWIQLMLASLNETGKAGVVMDNGVLTRSRSEKKIRKPILEEDLVEAVIALPENLFYNTSSPGCILILNKNKSKEQEGQVHFIYAEDQMLRKSNVQVYEELSNQNQLTEEGVEYLAETFLAGREEDHHSRLVDIEEIKDNDWSLSVPRYVDTTEPEEPVDVSKKIRELDKLAQKRRKTSKELQTYIQSLLAQEIEHADYEEQYLGPRKIEVPATWEKTRLEDVTEIITRGKQPTYVDEGGVPVLNQSCIYWDGFHPEEMKRLNEEVAADWKDKYWVKKGDVLINSTGKGTLGRALEWTKESNTHALDSHITRVHPDDSVLDPTYLRFYLESNHGQKMLYAFCVAGSTGQIELSKGDLMTMPILLPPLPEQKEISKAFRRVNRNIQEVKEIKQGLQDLKRGLTQDLLTGEVRVDPDS